jgi:hypothetical protein
MKFQPRDAEMLQAINDNQGILARRHLKALFWQDKSWRAMEQRLAKLFHIGYLCWPGKDHYKIYPIPEAICWLGWRGALYTAGLMGIEVDPPKGENEYQLRLLEGKLRKKGFHWLREPRWSLLEHDLAIIDFRLAIEAAVPHSSSLRLTKWVSEKEFRSFNDTVIAEVKTIRGQDIPIRKKVFPDGYFEILNEKLHTLGEPSRMRFLLEFDMGTHDTLRFGRDKVMPGVEYIKSSIYKSRFGSNNGHWLIIAKGGSTRIKNLMFQVEKNAGNNADLFFFAAINELENNDPLTAPIWQQVGRNKPRSLLVI